MTTTVQAIYENGKLTLPKPLPLAEQTRVRVTIETQGKPDASRESWLKHSEESLMRAWDNPEDDAFNELLKK